MIYKRGWVQTLTRYELEALLEEKGVSDIKKIVLIFHGEDWQNEAPYPIVKPGWFRKEEVKIWQRFNQLWFVPLYLLSIPLQWLFTGGHGFSNNSKTGKLISKIPSLG